jgi:hypothetical protein
MAGCGGLSAGVRHPGQPPRTAAAEPSGALPQVPPPSDPSGEVAAAGRHRPHRTSAQPEPSAPVCVRRPVNPSGRRTPRRTRPPQRRRCSWPLCGMGPDTDRRCLTGRGHLLSAARQRTGRVHWQNDQQPCPSSLRQKGRSGCVQAAVMEPVGGHLTAAGRHPGHPVRRYDNVAAHRIGHRKQRTVNPLMASTRYNFLYSPQGRPCGRPPAAAVLGRKRHDRSPEAGLAVTGPRLLVQLL